MSPRSARALLALEGAPGRGSPLQTCFLPRGLYSGDATPPARLWHLQFGPDSLPGTGCRLDLRAPFPYIPTESVCVAWKERKSGACKAQVDAAILAPVDPNQPQGRLNNLHLAAQCQCYPGRRKAIEACNAEADCEAFAGCVIGLVNDGWMPPVHDDEDHKGSSRR